MMQSRTHTCGQLRLEHAGQTVTLAGFMENVREVSGSLAFVVLRDFYGITSLYSIVQLSYHVFRKISIV